MLSFEQIHTAVKAMLDEIIPISLEDHAGAPIKEQILIKHKATNLTALDAVLQKFLQRSIPQERALIEELKQYLEGIWTKINGTFLSYTALPHDPFTLIHVNLAITIATRTNVTLQTHVSSLKLLIPTLKTTTHFLEGYPDLAPYQDDKEQWILPDVDIFQVLATHIQSDKGEYLIPVRHFVQAFPNGKEEKKDENESIDTRKSLLKRNPYSDMDDVTSFELTPNEIERLQYYSRHTEELTHAESHLAELANNNASFLGHLNRFLDVLYLSSNANQGKEEDAGFVAYSNIIHFNEYYKNSLSKEERAKIPEELRNAIEKLLVLSSNPDKNKEAVKQVETCTYTRRWDIYRKKEKYDALLATIGVQARDQVDALLKKAIDDVENTKSALKDALDQNKLEGADPLGIKHSLLVAYDIQPQFARLEELSLVTSLPPKEITEVLKHQPLREHFNNAIYNSQILISLTLGMSPERLNAMLEMLREELFNRCIRNNYMVFINWLHNLPPQNIKVVVRHYLDEIARIPRMLYLFHTLREEQQQAVLNSGLLNKIDAIFQLSHGEAVSGYQFACQYVKDETIWESMLAAMSQAAWKEFFNQITPAMLQRMLILVRGENVSGFEYVCRYVKDPTTWEMMVSKLNSDILAKLVTARFFNLCATVKNKQIWQVIVDKLGATLLETVFKAESDQQRFYFQHACHHIKDEAIWEIFINKLGHEKLANLLLHANGHRNFSGFQYFCETVKNATIWEHLLKNITFKTLKDAITLQTGTDYGFSRLCSHVQDKAIWQAIVDKLTDSGLYLVLIDMMISPSDSIQITRFQSACHKIQSADIWKVLLEKLSSKHLTSLLLNKVKNVLSGFETACKMLNAEAFEALIGKLPPDELNRVLQYHANGYHLDDKKEIIKRFVDRMRHPGITFTQSPQSTVDWIQSFVYNGESHLFLKKYISQCLKSVNSHTPIGLKQDLNHLMDCIVFDSKETYARDRLLNMSWPFLSLRKMPSRVQINLVRIIQEDIEKLCKNEQEINHLKTIMLTLCLANATNHVCAPILASESLECGQIDERALQIHFSVNALQTKVKTASGFFSRSLLSAQQLQIVAPLLQWSPEEGLASLSAIIATINSSEHRIKNETILSLLADIEKLSKPLDLASSSAVQEREPVLGLGLAS
jgi:hypothetical protein